MLKDYQKPHVGTRYKARQRKFNQFVFYNSLIIYNNWYTKTDKINDLTCIKRLFYNNSVLIIVHIKESK